MDLVTAHGEVRCVGPFRATPSAVYPIPVETGDVVKGDLVFLHEHPRAIAARYAALPVVMQIVSDHLGSIADAGGVVKAHLIVSDNPAKCRLQSAGVGVVSELFDHKPFNRDVFDGPTCE